MKRHSITYRIAIMALLTVGLTCGSAQALTWSGENVPTTNTMLLYHFNGTGTTVIDSGPSGRTNYMNNVAARVGSAPSWLTAATGDYISQPVGSGYEAATGIVQNLTVDFNSGYSMTCWFRYPTNQAQNGVLIYTESPRVIVFINNVGDPIIEGKIWVQRTGAASNSVNYEVTDNNFHLFGLVYDPLNGDASDGGKWRFYIDGVQISGLDDPADLGSDNNISLTVGKNYFGGAAAGIEYDEFLVENAMISDFSQPNGGVGGSTFLDEYTVSGFTLAGSTVSVDVDVSSNGVPYSLIYTTNLLTNPQPLGSGTADTQNGNGSAITLQDTSPSDMNRIYWIRSN